MLLNNITRPSVVSVHFVRDGEIETSLHSLTLKVLEGSIGNVSTEKEFFAVVASAMKFPDYFGSNWDALDECLRDMDWLPSEGYLLILRDSSKGWSQCPYILGRFVSMWLEAAEDWSKEKTPFHLIFVM